MDINFDIPSMFSPTSTEIAKSNSGEAFVLHATGEYLGMPGVQVSVQWVFKSQLELKAMLEGTLTRLKELNHE